MIDGLPVSLLSLAEGVRGEKRKREPEDEGEEEED